MAMGYSLREPALAFAARELCAQRVEALVPEAPVAFQPFVDPAQWGRVDRVEAAGAHRAHSGETVVAQHSQVLGDGGLGYPELLLHHRPDLSRRLLAPGQQLEDAAADRIAENV